MDENIQQNLNNATNNLAKINDNLYYILNKLEDITLSNIPDVKLTYSIPLNIDYVPDFNISYMPSIDISKLPDKIYVKSDDINVNLLYNKFNKNEFIVNLARDIYSRMDFSNAAIVSKNAANAVGFAEAFYNYLNEQTIYSGELVNN